MFCTFVLQTYVLKNITLPFTVFFLNIAKALRSTVWHQQIATFKQDKYNYPGYTKISHGTKTTRQQTLTEQFLFTINSNYISTIYKEQTNMQTCNIKLLESSSLVRQTLKKEKEEKKEEDNNKTTHGKISIVVASYSFKSLTKHPLTYSRKQNKHPTMHN